MFGHSKDIQAIEITRSSCSLYNDMQCLQGLSHDFIANETVLEMRV